MTKACGFSTDGDCLLVERAGREPDGFKDCHICALLQISDVLISIWGLLDEKKEVKADD